MTNAKEVYRDLFRTAQQMVKFERLADSTDDPFDYRYYRDRTTSAKKYFYSTCKLYGLNDLILLQKMICTII